VFRRGPVFDVVSLDDKDDGEHGIDEDGDKCACVCRLICEDDGPLMREKSKRPWVTEFSVFFVIPAG
jgi:hypothetical protein